MTEPEGADAATSPDPTLDRYARMVQRYLEVPIGLVTLVEPGRQVFPGQAGLTEPLATARETPLSHSFCRYVVADQTPLVVDDARLDERLRDNPAIEEQGVIAYAGWPLIDESGRTIGSLCAIDHLPRHWTREDLDALADLADACSAEMLYRRRQRDAEAQAATAQALSHRSQVLLALSEGLSVTRTLDDIAYAVERVAVDNLGCLRAGIWLRTTVEGQDRLRYLADPTAGHAWTSALRNADLPLDDSNPLGACLVSGRAEAFADRAEQNQRYPHLDTSRQEGEGRLFMPLSLGKVFGALAMLWDDAHEVGPEERITIATLASYTAQAVQRALLLREREEASMTLQSAMLTTLPRAEGMELEAVYRPAAAHDRVGGDWYDAVVTPSGQTNLMIGDVMGHDMAAAAVMGQLRNMLRALSWSHDDSPAENVTRLDEAAATFGMDRFASLLYLRVSPDDGSGRRTLTWTNAGHFPPLLIHPDGSTEMLEDDGVPDLLLGVDPPTKRRDQAAHLPDGTTLLLYTDGLVERRSEPIDAGLARLAAVAGRQADRTPAALLDGVLDGMVGFSHEDDVAALAVRFT